MGITLVKISSFGSPSHATARNDLLREEDRKEVGSGRNGPQAVMTNPDPQAIGRAR